MPDFTDLISQAKKMQEKMKEAQEALKKIEVEGISGGNAVKVIMNGDGELKKNHPLMMLYLRRQKKFFVT